MCGILNIINKKKRPLNKSQAERALSKLYWRGPDLDVAYYPDEHIFLGQTVLSLVGNVEKEAQGQYLWSASKRFYVNFNGEIYNYQELSQSFLDVGLRDGEKTTDTEVLVKLHDKLAIEDIPKELDGMYAYSIFDKESNSLFLARDLQGEKTLYIYEDDEFFVVSSQIDAIKEFIPNLEINTDTLKDYFYTRHFLQVERTVYKNIKQIPAGSLNQFNFNDMSFKLVSQLNINDLIQEEKMDELNSLGEDELIEMLDSILSKCVKQMVPIDRKYASVLSGGIDSSLLSAMASEYRKPDLLVAINHQGKEYISDDLSKFGQKIKQEISLLDVTSKLYSSEISKSVSTLGSPLLSHSFIGQSIQSRYVMNQDCKALFGGEGADELFGGYSCYIKPQINTPTCPSLYSGFFKHQEDLFEHDTTLLEQELQKGWQESLQAYDFISDIETKTTLAQMLCDFKMQVSNVAMRGADLMSMQWSIETRSIFVRKPILEFALNLPLKYKLNEKHKNPLMHTKYLLKKVFCKYFGEDLVVKKQGFSGFPNESKAILGEYDNFLVLEQLGIPKEKLKKELSRETAWKLINVEHFLRSF